MNIHHSEALNTNTFLTSFVHFAKFSITRRLGVAFRSAKVAMLATFAERKATLKNGLLPSLLGYLVFSLLGDAIAQEIPAPSQLNSAAELLGYEFEFPALGTKVQLKSFHDNKQLVQTAFEQAARTARELEAVLTDYNPQSEARQLSSLAFKQATRVSDPLWEVMLASDKWTKLSDGAFDSSLGKLTQLWRKYRRVGRTPNRQEIEAAKAATGWQHVQLFPNDHSVRFLHDDLQLDFGAIGKGYVVDRMFEVLCAYELPCSLVNISGNMRVGSPPPERQGWRIEIAALEKDGQPLRQVLLADKAIATSGDLWQFIVIDGVRRSHILDPRTGLGVPGPQCATAIAKNATDADALATLACVLGFKRAAEIASHLPDTQLLTAQRLGEGGAIEITHTGGSLWTAPNQSPTEN